MGMLEEPWQLSSDVALRTEPFGALAYNFATRRLTFLKRPDLVTVVGGLAAGANVREVLVAASIPTSQWPAYLTALESLAVAGTIQPRNQTELQKEGANS